MKINKPRIAIIGGSGKMGEWFARFLKQDGFDIVISGRDGNRLRLAAERLGVPQAPNKEAVSGADIILLSVPINSFESVVKEISPFLNSSQIVVNITSVKGMPVNVMHRYMKNNLVLGTHPLFGPGAKNLAGMNFALTPTNEKENIFAQKVKEYLELKQAVVTITSPEDHDKMMTVVLGLSHFIALVAADTLSRTDYKMMEGVEGITYRVLMTMIESVVSEDPELYASIQTSLPGLPDLEKRFCKTADVWAEIVRCKDTALFTAKMKELKALFTSHTEFGKSYARMYDIAK